MSAEYTPCGQFITRDSARCVCAICRLNPIAPKTEARSVDYMKFPVIESIGAQVQTKNGRIAELEAALRALIDVVDDCYCIRDQRCSVCDAKDVLAKGDK